MTYETTPTPPPPANRGGRPRAYDALAESIANAPDGEWVVVPAAPNATAKSIRAALKRTYFPDHNLRSRYGEDGTLYVRLGGNA